MKMEKEEFQEFVYNMRKASGLSCGALARALGCSRSRINQYENGLKIPKDTGEFEDKLRSVVKAEIQRRRNSRDELEYV
jgi:predicted transcriptional regulator